MYIAYEGQNIECSQQFFDVDGKVANLKVGYPTAKLLLGKKLLSVVYPVAKDDYWVAGVTIPDLQFNEPKPITLKWQAYDVNGHRYKIEDAILVQPSNIPKVGDIVCLEKDATFAFVLPYALLPEQTATLTVYRNNELVASLDVPTTSRTVHTSYTLITLPRPALRPQLDQYLVIIDYLNFKFELQKTMFNLWVVTPQMLNVMNMIDADLNRAKLENVLPQLEYKQSDLLLWMQRGLNLYNSYNPNLTNFDGTNMQGGNFDALVLCSSYYALAAQLLAEGMLAFDFSGQAVTLSVDRTPALEAALGRIESTIQDRIPKIKQMLLRRGVSGGSGSNSIGSSVGYGHVVVSNSPTTSRNIYQTGGGMGR